MYLGWNIGHIFFIQNMNCNRCSGGNQFIAYILHSSNLIGRKISLSINFYVRDFCSQPPWFRVDIIFSLKNSRYQMLTWKHEEMILLQGFDWTFSFYKNVLPECCCIWSSLRFQSTAHFTISPTLNGADVLDSSTKWCASAPLRWTSSTGKLFINPKSHGCPPPSANKIVFSKTTL